MAYFSDPTNYEMQVVENFGRIRDRLTLRLENPHASLDVSQFFLDKACLGFFKCSSILIQICQLLIARDRRCWSSSGFACSVKQAKLLIGSKLLLAIQIWHRRNQQLWLADITAPQHSISSRWNHTRPFLWISNVESHWRYAHCKWQDWSHTWLKSLQIFTK